MKKTAEFIVNSRKIICLIFIGLIIFSLFSFSWVKVENDITVYLADSAEAKRGLTIMQREFKTYATADIMIDNISLQKAHEIADKISNLKGVLQLSFSEDESHYKDGNALFNIRFSGTSSSEDAQIAMANIKRLLAETDYYISSESFSNLSDIINTEMLAVLGIVIVVVLAVLIFTSTTYAEVGVLLLNFLAAAIINMGTNFLMGTISFVSNAVAVVLQLALSVDYAIILCNRYKEEHTTKPVKEAAVSALALSIPEIFASSLTTVAGLLAMTFMQFKLGLDMGIALIKAIIISLITVFTLMPALLILFGEAMDNTRHKSFVPRLSFIGRFASATSRIIPPIFFIVVMLGYYGYSNVSYAYSMDLVNCIHRNSEDLAKEHIEATFGENNMLAMIIPSEQYEKEAALVKELEACPEINSILSLASIDAIDGYRLPDEIGYREFMELADVDELTAKALFTYYSADNGSLREEDELEAIKAPLIDIFLAVHDIAESGKFELSPEQRDMIQSLYSQLEMAEEQLHGENYSRIIIYMNLPQQGEATFDFLDKMHEIADKYYDEGVILAGNAVSAKDFNGYFERDAKIVSILSIALVMLILLFTFKMAGMPILLIFVIQGSIWLNFALAVAIGNYVFFMCNLIVSSIQMGANIDYAIVMSSRYIDLRRNKLTKSEAISEAVNLSFPTIITSGTMMVIAGLVIGCRVSQVVIAGMGLYVGTGTIISLILVNFALPQLLLLGDGIIYNAEKPVETISPPKKKKLLAAALAGALIIGLLSVVPVNHRLKQSTLSYKADCQALYQECSELKLLLEKLNGGDGFKDAKLSYAEHFTTELVGTEKLSDGQKEYNEGKEALSDAYQQLKDGERAYSDGRDTLEAGKQEYEAGKALLAEKQAEFDAGEAGFNDAKAQLDEGKEALAAGERKLMLIKPIYDRVMPIYAQYQDYLRLANEARANGDDEKAAEYDALATQYEAYVSRELAGYSIESIINDYEAGEAQIESAKLEIASAEAQLKEAENTLNDAKAMLDDGYKQLSDAKEAIDAGQLMLDISGAQLSDGKKQYAEGEAALEEAYTQLEDGKATLKENREKLSGEISALDSMAGDNISLRAGISKLKARAELSEIAADADNDADFLEKASAYYQTELNKPDLLVYVYIAEIVVLCMLCYAFIRIILKK